MLELAIALVIIAGLAYKLGDKWLDQKPTINTESVDTAELSAAIDVKLKLFDDRINNTWGTVSSVKEDLNALKLQIALKVR